jgi:phospholipid transport system transporter-binding protein
VNAAGIQRDGETLRFRGALLRANTAAAWARFSEEIGDGQSGGAAGNARRFDLGAVESIDSAGLALLSLLATRCGGVEVSGDPPGFAELRRAYRLGTDLTFVRD